MSPLLCALSLALAQTPPAPADADAGAIADAGTAEADAGAADAGETPPPPPAPPPALCPCPVPPPPPPGPPATTASVGLGLIWLQGNSNALTFSGNLAVAHKFDWGFGLSGTFNSSYGQSQPAGSTVESVTAYNLGGLIRTDKTLASSGVQIFAQGGASGDHVASLELRYFGEAGAGIIWLDQKGADYQKTMLRTDLGFRAQQDDNWQYYPTATSPTTGALPDIFFLGPRFGLVFLYAFNKGVVFSEDASLLENIDGNNRTMVSSMTKLNAQLVSHLALSTTFLVTYDDNLSNLGKLDTDTALTVGLEGTF